MSNSPRIYPLKRPEGHQPPVPRFRLVAGSALTHVHVVYVGVQRHDVSEVSDQAQNHAIQAVHDWVDEPGEDRAAVVEQFDPIPILGDHVTDARVWVCYWNSRRAYDVRLGRLSLSKIYSSLPQAGRDSIGLWCETFSIPTTRLETNYTSPDYLPGVGSLPETTTEPHTLTAYWGAARDRIADSAHDLFPASNFQAPAESVSQGRLLRGTNTDNVVFIRTGQFWENCDDEEAEAYERRLEPSLEAGLGYLGDNPATTGAMGLRYLRNVGEAKGKKRRETCVTGFFTSLDMLEGWAKSHKSHLAIYNGAMRHAKTYGPDRKLRTWHEVVVLKKDEAKMEYVNCTNRTGLIAHLEMENSCLAI
ncbi:putative phenylacetaldoxime dehydratase family protein [Stachybotrys elegans]|uniref:Phenylacetaldoxime dehydratase family protein n=1 Tax=Stachybotrys elegans TaxID=80388 RepID=A0A8K0SXL8_9HYPO|nr:putative phenylacetaldoxime dehydratase family protein [Stachybotrys elegans]